MKVGVAVTKGESMICYDFCENEGWEYYCKGRDFITLPEGEITI